RAAESVTQLLAEQPGASVTRLGGLGAMATLSLRGSASNQVLVYVDGVPLNSITGGGVDLGAIPLGDVERMEIYRGTSPIGFGASGIGGVVSITTTVPTENTASVEVGGGSFGTEYGGARGSWNGGRVRVAGGVHVFNSVGDFPYRMDRNSLLTTGDDLDTRRANNALLQFDATLRTLVELGDRRRLTATAAFLDRSQGWPGLGNTPNRRASLGTVRATASLAYESRQELGSGSNLRAVIYGAQLRTHFQDLLPPNVSTDAVDTTSTAGATLRLSRPMRTWLTMSGILDGRTDEFVAENRGSPVSGGAPATRWFGAAGVESDFWVRPWRLNLIGSFRLESVHDRTAGRDYFGNLVQTADSSSHVLPVARLSLLEEWGAGKLRANVGRYGRMPSTMELYGDTGYVLGKPTLRPESGVNADLGGEINWRRTAWSMTVASALFASWVKDLIQYQSDSYGRARPDNVGGARVLGVEGSLAATLGRFGRLVAEGTFTDARDTSDVAANRSHQLPLRPRYRAYARPELRGLPLSARTALGLYVDVDATSGNFLNSPNTAQVPARLMFGAGVSLSMPAKLRLVLSAQNLGDSRINDVTGYPLPGRACYATLTWSYDNPKEKL
ncbi:MAG TPA: TonB-dependent receptor, partial [Polyangia bacterium]